MKSNELRLPSYGGQALIEGVLMRGKYALAAAFRKPDGKIEIRSEKLAGIYHNQLFQVPFIRGLVILWDSLILGMRYLTLSANIQAGSEQEKIEGSSLYGAVIVSIFLAILLFFVSPLLLTSLINSFFPMNTTLYNFFEGLFRLIVMILYLSLISNIPEIKKVFGYHGAEHKTINAFEDHAHLNVSSVMKYSVQHPRCGTSFLLTLILFSIIIFTLIGDLTFLVKIVSRIALIPILAMVSYEFIRWLGNHQENRLVKWISKPNLALQNLTTREPTPEMVEVAIQAFNSLMELENHSKVEA
jgi:uncharacterized protein YqhQ